MAGIGLGSCVAIRALENRIVGGVGVALRTDSPGTAMVRWKPGVVEYCTGPRGRAMASLACARESRSRMVRIRRPLVVQQVALNASCIDKLVIAVGVAALTRLSGVGTRKRELCSAVIERRRLPRRRSVADLAILAESRRHMIRVRRTAEVCLMARVTAAVYELVVSAGMACLARPGFVSTCQRETRQAVIEAGNP